MRFAFSLIFAALAFAFLAGVARTAAAGGGDLPPVAEDARQNHPPVLHVATVAEPNLTDGMFAKGPVIRCDRTTRVTLRADDPDGDVLVYSAVRLPAGATLDASEGVVTWRPTKAQLGTHEIEFVVSDGRSVGRRTLSFLVRPNRAPAAAGEPTILLFAWAAPPVDRGPLGGSDDDGSALLAMDRDGDALSIRTLSKPPAATITESEGSVSLSWRPTPKDVGEHEIALAISDGELLQTVHRKVLVLPEGAREDYRGFLLLGGGPSAFLAHDDGELFVGGALDVTFAAISRSGRHQHACATGQEDRCGASHHRFYGAFEVLDSMRHGEPSLFTYSAGYSGSLELFPARNTLIPHYGFELGGLVREGLGHRAQTTPYLGLHLFADRHVWLNLALGYRVVPAELYGLSGPTFTLRGVINPW